MEFTQREKKILNLLASGLTDKEIALKLKVSEGTVQASLLALKRILGAKNRQNMVFIACQKDLIKI